MRHIPIRIYSGHHVKFEYSHELPVQSELRCIFQKKIPTGKSLGIFINISGRYCTRCIQIPIYSAVSHFPDTIFLRLDNFNCHIPPKIIPCTGQIKPTMFWVITSFTTGDPACMALNAKAAMLNNKRS